MSGKTITPPKASNDAERGWPRVPRATYAEIRAALLRRYPLGVAPGGVKLDHIIQLKLQNTYSTHLDIARDMASVMRADMAEYDRDNARFTQSLGCWSGFHA